MQVNGLSNFDKIVSVPTPAQWQTLRAIYTTPSAASGKKLQFISSGGAATFYVDSVHLIDMTNLLRWQEFRYDDKGRTLLEAVLDPATATILQQVSRSYVPSGNGGGLLQEVIQADIGGGDDVTTTYFYDPSGRVVQTNQSSNFGSCEKSRTVYDAAGNVVATLCNFDPGVTDPIYPADVDDAKTLRQRLYNVGDPDHYTDPNTNRLTIYEYDEMGRRVQVISNAEDPYQQITLTAYDALNRVVRSISNYVADASVPNPYTAARNAFQHGSNNNQNLVTDTVYNARGMVRQQVDILGNVTLYGYDVAGRLVKTIQNASWKAYNNDYVGSSPDPSLSLYMPSTKPDQDIITRQGYDPAGNLVQTIDALGNVSYTVYDALNRPFKTVRFARDTATIALNPGDNRYDTTNDPRSNSYIISTDPDRDLIETTEYDAMGRVIRTQRLLDNRPTQQWDTTLYGYDRLGRQVKVIRSASQADYNIAGDPSLASYPESEDADQDIVTQTAYDANGRVMYTQDSLGTKTWMAYDGLGRQIKTVANAVGTATDNGVDDPRSPYYNAVVNPPDRDITTQTTYDSDGRVLHTQDAIGRKNWTSYDEIGRQVRSIGNAVGTATNGGPLDPRSPSYIRSQDSDKDIITQTVYDAQGRVQTTIDTLGNPTRYEYDILGRRTKTITNFVDGMFNLGLPDEDRIDTTTYDLAGRVTRTRDAAGIETRYEYDALGRRVKTITNYVDGRFNTNEPDKDLISKTVYNKAGQVVSTTDARGTKTTFTYDHAGRRLTVTQAAGTSLASTAYTCYDKTGRVLRTIQNWIAEPTDPSPDAQDVQGNWLFAPDSNGMYNDQNLITRFAYDRASRRIIVTDPLGNASLTAYFKDGQVKSLTDPEGMVTQYRYDGLRRRTRVIQGFIDNGEDPAKWVYNSGWKKSDGTTTIQHTDGVSNNQDRNVIVEVAYDKAGRMISLRNPRGYLTTYTYDLRDRRTSLTNPLNQTWLTHYANQNNGTSRTTMTYPGIHADPAYDVERQFDRLGRLTAINYGDPTTTPDVSFSYDAAGNRATMTENNGTSNVRQTTYAYDDLRRLTSVGFDNDGGGTIDETVSYAYDAGGLRTQLTLPGSLNVTYTYDAKGQLTSLTDWDSQKTRFAYDQAGRHIATERANRLRSRYAYDAAGRLRLLRHSKNLNVLAHFAFEVDGRGNRTQATEFLLHPEAAGDVTLAYNDSAIVYSSDWSNSAPFKVSDSFSAHMAVTMAGDTIDFTYGVGPDHSIFDVYIGGTLWQSYDGYADSTGEVTQIIELNGNGPRSFEIRNRHEKNLSSTGYKVRFKQLVLENIAYDLHTITYEYDLLSRLLKANYYPAQNLSATPFRTYDYWFDVAGNRRLETINGDTPTTYTYNEANQIVGLTYDANGNLISDGTNTYSLDRANRLLRMGGVSYAYDGEGRRVSQTVSSVVTKYLLDIQPGLSVVLGATTGSDTTRYIHSLRGIHAQEDNSGTWTYPVQDALGSVRVETDANAVVRGMRNFDPFGNVFGEDVAMGFEWMPYNFTGEPRDGNGLNYHRARYLNPQLGVWASLDPFEGVADRAMSLNSYSWVEGNAPNAVDPSGLFTAPLMPPQNSCFSEVSSCYTNVDNSSSSPMLKELLRLRCFVEQVKIAMNSGSITPSTGAQLIHLAAELNPPTSGADRREMTVAFYDQSGLGYGFDSGLGYGRSEVDFFDWEYRRGAVDRSLWWKAVNRGLIVHPNEAFMLKEAGLESYVTSGEVDGWIKYLNNPNAVTWYEAHNRTIVSGYLHNQNLANQEPVSEQLLMANVLNLVIYAQSMPSANITNWFIGLESNNDVISALGAFANDPRGGSVAFAVGIDFLYPANYPLTRSDKINVYQAYSLLSGLVWKDRYIDYPFSNRTYNPEVARQIGFDIAAIYFVYGVEHGNALIPDLP